MQNLSFKTKKIVLFLILSLVLQGCEYNSKNSNQIEKTSQQTIEHEYRKISAFSILKSFVNSSDNTVSYDLCEITEKLDWISWDTHRNIFFSNCTFDKDVTFHGDIGKILFLDCTFKKNLTIYNKNITSLAMCGCSVNERISIWNLNSQGSTNNCEIKLVLSKSKELGINSVKAEYLEISKFKTQECLISENQLSKLRIYNMTQLESLRITGNEFINCTLTDVNAKQIDIANIDKNTTMQFFGVDSKQKIILSDFQPKIFSIDYNHSINEVYNFLEQKTEFNKDIYTYFMNIAEEQHDNKAKAAFYASIKKHDIENMSFFERIFYELALFIKYGNYPDDLCRILIGIFGVNLFFFQKKRMTPTIKKPVYYHFSCLSSILYCFAILFPFYQFRIKSEWQPKPECRLTKIWLALSTFIGYVCFSLLAIIIIKIIIIE